jgi:hypothetical protein
MQVGVGSPSTDYTLLIDTGMSILLSSFPDDLSCIYVAIREFEHMGWCRDEIHSHKHEHEHSQYRSS